MLLPGTIQSSLLDAATSRVAVRVLNLRGESSAKQFGLNVKIYGLSRGRRVFSK